MLAATFWGHMGIHGVMPRGQEPEEQGCGPSQQSRACAGSVTLLFIYRAAVVDRDSTCQRRGTGHHVELSRKAQKSSFSLHPLSTFSKHSSFLLKKKRILFLVKRIIYLQFQTFHADLFLLDFSVTSVLHAGKLLEALPMAILLPAWWTNCF